MPICGYPSASHTSSQSASMSKFAKVIAFSSCPKEPDRVLWRRLDVLFLDIKDVMFSVQTMSPSRKVSVLALATEHTLLAFKLFSTAMYLMYPSALKSFLMDRARHPIPSHTARARRSLWYLQWFLRGLPYIQVLGILVLAATSNALA